MKKLFLFSMVLFMLAFASCKKQDDLTPKTGKMLLPQVSLVQGSELITKSADLSVDQITYEFWVKNGSVWAPAGKGLFKDGSDAQAANNYSWTTAYPNQCQTCFIEVPLNMQTRIVAKVMKGGKIKFYGIFETPVSGFEHTGDQIVLTQMKAYEINSRLKLDVSDLAKNTNFNFVLTFSGTVKDVDYSNIVQSLSTSWMFTKPTGNDRNYESMPLTSAGTAYSQTFSVLGYNSQGTPADYKLGTAVAISTVVGSKTYFEIYEFFGQGSNDSKVTYSITRVSDGASIKTNLPIVATGPTTKFATNWLQAGYNFTITMLADPQALGKGCFTTDLVYNTEVTGTVNL